MKKIIFIFLVLFLLFFAIKIVYDLTHPEVVARFREKDSPKQTSYNLYFIALEDSGRRGPKIGCDDSVVAVQKSAVEVNPELAVRELLQIRTDTYQNTGLYNAFYQSNLDVLSIETKDDKASLYLKGNLRLGGTCDSPRFEAQLTQTLKQFPHLKEVSIYVNGRPLQEVTSGR